MELIFALKVSGAIMSTNLILYLACGHVHLASMPNNKQVQAAVMMPVQSVKLDITVKDQTEQNFYVSLATIVLTFRQRQRLNSRAQQGPIILIMVQLID